MKTALEIMLKISGRITAKTPIRTTATIMSIAPARILLGSKVSEYSMEELSSMISSLTEGMAGSMAPVSKAEIGSAELVGLRLGAGILGFAISGFGIEGFGRSGVGVELRELIFFDRTAN